jgi:hypothetical protein
LDYFLAVNKTSVPINHLTLKQPYHKVSVDMRLGVKRFLIDAQDIRQSCGLYDVRPTQRMPKEIEMTPEAQRILDVFRQRGIRAGGRIHPADFGDAIVWEQGFVRDEAVRQALSTLFEEGLLIELRAAFELTERGEQQVYGEQQPKRDLGG